MRFCLVGRALLASGIFFCADYASATTISGDLTSDNAFFAFISTNNAVLGTLVAEGNDWTTTFALPSTALTPGVTNYLQIEAINQGGPGMFIGQFSLSDTQFHFFNGGQSLLTDTTDWVGSFNNTNSAFAQQPWVQPNGLLESYGPNGAGPWGTRPGIDSNALFVWASDPLSTGGCGFNGGYCTIDLSAPIFSNAAATPLPAALPLFATALGAMGLFGWRRKRRNTALAA